MTKQPMSPRDLWESIDFPNWIGFDEIFEKISGGTIKAPSYPPYNIIKDSESKWTLEIASAGFAESDFDIGMNDGKLTIAAKKDTSQDTQFTHRGIANRDFSLTFNLGEYVEVTETSYVNGLLVISLERIVPEEKKPRKIEIGFKKEPEKQLLTE